MTIAVDLGREATKQTKSMLFIIITPNSCNEVFVINLNGEQRMNE